MESASLVAGINKKTLHLSEQQQVDYLYKDFNGCEGMERWQSQKNLWIVKDYFIL